MSELRLPGLLWLTELLDNAVQVGVRFDASPTSVRTGPASTPYYCAISSRAWGLSGCSYRKCYPVTCIDIIINRSISSCTFLPDRDPDELVWKHLRADTVGRMTITEKADFKARSAHPCAKLQNDPEKIPTKNHRLKYAA